jgi:hypothetical protein
MPQSINSPTHHTPDPVACRACGAPVALAETVADLATGRVYCSVVCALAETCDAGCEDGWHTVPALDGSGWETYHCLICNPLGIDRDDPEGGY